jgi:hypothetical protein
MPVTIAPAIAACEAACDSESSAHAYEALLSAAGNNHAGTYNSSVLALLSAIQPLLGHGESWPQRAALAALEALIDLYGSFEPEPNCQVYLGEQLAVTLRQRIAAMESKIRVIAKSAGVASAGAQGLLELLHEPAA